MEIHLEDIVTVLSVYIYMYGEYGYMYTIIQKECILSPLSVTTNSKYKLHTHITNHTTHSTLTHITHRREEAKYKTKQQQKKKKKLLALSER